MSSFASQPIPSHTGPPASATPLCDYLNDGAPGVLPGYVVVPRGLAERMPLMWQRQMVAMLAELHQAHTPAPWPRYAVAACRAVPLTGCDERQLAAVDVATDLDDQGAQLVYRDIRTGEVIAEPASRRVLVTVADPLDQRETPQ